MNACRHVFFFVAMYADNNGPHKIRAQMHFLTGIVSWVKQNLDKLIIDIKILFH